MATSPSIRKVEDALQARGVECRVVEFARTTRTAAYAAKGCVPIERPSVMLNDRWYYVRARTGFAIGGVPPVAHAEPLDTYIDEDLLRFDEIWASAGTPFAVFRLRPETLARLTGGRVADLKA